MTSSPGTTDVGIAGVLDRVKLPAEFAIQAEGSAIIQNTYRFFSEFDKQESASEGTLLSLLSDGICIEARDKGSVYFTYTPLMLAARFGKTQAVMALMALGADVQAANDDGDTVLICAAATGRQEVVRALLVAGADIHAVDNIGSTALMHAALHAPLETTEVETIHALIAAGVDLQAANEDDETALLWAAARGLKETAQVLITSGASVAATKKFPEYEWLQKQANQLANAIWQTIDRRAKQEDLVEVKGDDAADSLYKHFAEGKLTPQTREAIGFCMAMDPMVVLPNPPSDIERLNKWMLHFKWNSPEKLRELLKEMTDHWPIDHTVAEAIYHSIQPQSRGQWTSRSVLQSLHHRK